MSNIITMVYFFVLNLESSLNNKKLIGYNVKIHRRYHRMKQEIQQIVIVTYLKQEIYTRPVFRKNEHVILLDEGREWVMKIKQLFTCVPVLSKYCFVGGEYYVTKTIGGRVDYDNWTGQPKLIPRQFQRLCVQPLKYVDRKVSW